MKIKRILSMILATTVLTSSLAAYAEPNHGWHSQRDGHQQGNIKDRHHPEVGSSHYRAGQPRPYQDWRAGQRLPTAYRGQAYYVNDWRAHGLRQPPQGQRWVKVNGDYVLVAIATNVIAQVLLGR